MENEIHQNFLTSHQQPSQKNVVNLQVKEFILQYPLILKSQLRLEHGLHNG